MSGSGLQTLDSVIAGQRRFPTPEGTVITVSLAERTERATALLIDLSIIFAIHLLLGIASFFILKSAGFNQSGLSWLWTALLLLSFLIRSFYFTFFETRWQGRTPGKRLMALRVIDRNGGRLRADAIFTRNLLREVELFLPMGFLFSGGAADLGGWGNLALFSWMAVFVFLPCFNSDRLRAGDIAAGTWVIRAPKLTLLDDLSGDDQHNDQLQDRSSPPPNADLFQFSPAQLEVYGIFELQMLERVLRDTGRNRHEIWRAVYARIIRKIKWNAPAGFRDHRAFLEAYYTALRGHLEKRILFGKRRENKFDRSG